MGLFGRKNRETAEQLEALREEITALQTRLDATDAAKSRLEENVGALHAENGRLRDELLVQITTATASSNDATRTLAEQTAAHLEEQRARLADLAVVATDAAERATEAKQATDTVDERLDGAHRLVDEAGRRADERVDELVRRLGDTDTRLGTIDARLTQVATELANQLNELGDELERRDADDADRGGPDQGTEQVASLDAELIEELLDAQERLAAEQARYQIAFRQDLADLADRLKRQR